LVDDDPDIRMIGAMSLRRVGKLTVRTAASGLEALSLALAERPDAILLDVMMPSLDGPGTFKALRDRPEIADVPIIFLTAKVMAPEVERLVALGAVGVLGKPFDPMTLPSEVLRLLAPVGQ
jgi:CheY-like chemotaxis protein